ncbi:cupredoxin domain-containing protein [Geminicoccus roseus]|uniref:cupredoxin domain-containing protein n=1 Tax=Geminicoccus roseus TaxID=404900 RepID=UPI00041B6483|nr:plastocyanin/azurin family copper-binding protein [Geminicoccus roseus]
MFRTFATGAARLSVAALLLASVAVGTAVADAGHGSSSIGKPGDASDADRVIQIKMNDNFYEPESVQVRAGETIRFMLTNNGEFLHEFNIGTAAMHAEHQQEMAMMMEHGMLTPTGMNHDMDNMDHSKMGGMDMAEMKHDDPNSVLVEPGAKAELVWTFTEDTALEFACNIPGHYESGMVGPIKIRN